MEKTIQNVARENNRITIYRMDHPRCASDFIISVNAALRAGFTDIELNVDCGHNALFPNACVPIVAAIDNYRINYGITFNVNVIGSDKMIENTRFLNPIVLTTEEINQLPSPMNMVIEFSTYDQVYAFTQRCIHYISRQTDCEEGTLDGLIWCINEVMDNVTVHSECTHGYVMAQFHKQANRIAICVADAGVGIFNSLKNSKHIPKKPIDSLSLAVQEGVGDGRGQGNGLYGLYQIIRHNEGTLTLTSSGASIMVTKTGIENKYEGIPSVSSTTPGTVVDFQMNLNKKVDLQTAFSTIGGHDTIDFELESMMDDNNTIQYDVFEHCQGTATREAGRLLRNDVINTIRRANASVCLDFSKVATVSSSFIDEFIAKMFVGLGMVQFNQTIKVKSMNDTVKFLCERSLYMRIYEEWAKTKGESIEVIDE